MHIHMHSKKGFIVKKRDSFFFLTCTWYWEPMISIANICTLLFALSSLLKAINSKKEVVLVLELMLGTIFSSYIKHLHSDHAQLKRIILFYDHWSWRTWSQHSLLSGKVLLLSHACSKGEQYSGRCIKKVYTKVYLCLRTSLSC